MAQRGGPAGQYPGTTHQKGINLLPSRTAGQAGAERLPIKLFDAYANAYANDGNSYLAAVQVAITSAQIEALGTTAVTLVAAAGTGTLIVPQEIVFDFLYGGTAYVNGASGAPEYKIATGSGIVFWSDASAASPLDTILKGSANGLFVLDPAASPTGAQWSGSSASSLNAALQLSNAGGSTHDLVTGNGTLLVDVVFRVYTGLS